MEKSPIKAMQVLRVKEELINSNYREIGRKYGLSEMTVRRYESEWKEVDGKLISPSGRTYQISIPKCP